MILCYHRVTAALADPWGLCVTPERFAAQMQVLRHWAQPMPLTTLVDAALRGVAPPRGVAVTFDDGYLDNLTAAAEALARWEIPATVFVASGYITPPRAFWWDVVQDLCLARERLPALLTLDLDGTAHTWTLGAAATFDRAAAEATREWRAWTPPPTARHALYLDVWSRLRALPEAPRNAAIARIEAWADGCGASRNDAHVGAAPGTAMTAAQLRELAASGLVSLGAHTVTHPLLGQLPAAEQAREITESQLAVAAITGAPVTTFAYPYGDHTAVTRAAVRDAGFTLACGGGNAPVTPRSDRYAVPRLGVEDWDAAEFQTRLASAGLR